MSCSKRDMFMQETDVGTAGEHHIKGGVLKHNRGKEPSSYTTDLHKLDQRN